MTRTIFFPIFIMSIFFSLPLKAEVKTDSEKIKRGKELAFDRNAGNCLSCHLIPGGELPGNIAPPLIQMNMRFPDRAVLREQIWDASIRNENTVMPPYGKHNILTNDELELVVDFISSI